MAAKYVQLVRGQDNAVSVNYLKKTSTYYPHYISERTSSFNGLGILLISEERNMDYLGNAKLTKRS